MEGYDSVAEKLRRYKIPQRRLPLARDYRPYAGLTDEALYAFISPIEERYYHPECVAYFQCGRLADAVRLQEWNIPYSNRQLKTGRVVEAHLDCTTIPKDLLNFLVMHGFEPDHFHRFVPDCYPDHFTLKCVQDDEGLNIASIYTFVRTAMEIVVAELSGRCDVTGYCELETYSLSQNRLVQRFRVPTRAALEDFPFEEGALEVYEVPCVEDAKNGPIASTTSKCADIHIKTPLPVRGKRFADAESPVMEALRDRLRRMGFYEVVTGAGHKVYTAQFVRIRDARHVYTTLREYFRTHGGIVDITLEPCVGFWRSTTSDGKLARIPPVVLLR